MRRAAKVDANHGEIVEALRAEGASVQSLAGVGAGCPDLAVGLAGMSFLIEIKDGLKTPSKRSFETRSRDLDSEVARLARGHLDGHRPGDKIVAICVSQRLLGTYAVEDYIEAWGSGSRLKEPNAPGHDTRGAELQNAAGVLTHPQPRSTSQWEE